MRWTPGITAGLLAAVGLAGPVAGQQVVREIDWAVTAPLSGVVENGEAVVDAGPGIYPLAVIVDPPLGGGDILVSFPVGWRVSEQPAFMELWAVYDDGSRYFSRSLDATGVGLLRGTGDDTMGLPFYLSGTVPDALELNAVLPGGGRVEVGAVTLYEYPFASTSADAAPGWWSAAAARQGGGIAGAFVVLLGAAVGVTASRQRAPAFVLGTLKACGAAGVVGLAGGLVALAVGQPMRVWLLLVLVGVVVAAVFGGMIPRTTARYQAAELQRMRAHDLV